MVVCIVVPMMYGHTNIKKNTNICLLSIFTIDFMIVINQTLQLVLHCTGYTDTLHTYLEVLFDGVWKEITTNTLPIPNCAVTPHKRILLRPHRSKRWYT